VKTFEGLTELFLKINGESRRVSLRPGDTLLRILRDELGYTGPKTGCENGDCGACTVLLDGLAVKSCLILAVEAEGAEITTVEGLKDTPAATAFREEGAFQCGYCTAGFIVNAHALFTAVKDPSDDEISRWLNSNLCRCTGYESIQRAMRKAQKAY
jgi:carbon-monoxide dehydrogenase small subunit